jgi:hypothetical protein
MNYAKLISGRFWFTIIAGIIFLNMSISGFLDRKDVLNLITLIVVFYFNRNDRKTPTKGA